MKKAIFKKNRRLRRKRRVRKSVEGTAEQPRLATFRSLRHIYAQIVDDQAGVTLVASSTRSDNLSEGLSNSGNIDAAKKVGQALADKALSLGITKVCFDRNGCKYHGRIKALAEAAREAGLKF